MGNYLRSLADRIAGASRLRPRVRSLFEPNRGSEGVLAPGSAGSVTAPDAAMPRGPVSLETEATVDAVPPAPDAARASAAARRAASEERSPRTPAAPEPSEGMLRPTTPLRLSQLPRAASPEQQAAAPAAEGEPLSRNAATAVERTRALPTSTPPRRGASVPAEASPQTTAARHETATVLAPESQPLPHPGGTPRPLADRLRPAEDGVGRARQTVEPARPDAAAARAEPQASARAPSVASVEAAPTVQVVIGKITVQADTPSAPAPIAVRAATAAGPRLSLEQYLLQRGGRG
jgi:hypothetical protein